MKIDKKDKMDKKINILRSLLKTYNLEYVGDPLKYDSSIIEAADRTTDCIECGSCKLWGKIQLYGAAAAIKILANEKVEAKDIVFLIHLLWKLSETVDYVKEFENSEREKKKDEKVSGLVIKTNSLI